MFMISVFLWKKELNCIYDLSPSSMSLLHIICYRSKRDSFDFVKYVLIDFNFPLCFSSFWRINVAIYIQENTPSVASSFFG